MSRITASPVTIPVPPELDEHRMVYNGDDKLPPVAEPMRANRPVRRKQRSPFGPMFVLLVLSMLIVFYIWNKITIDRLARETNELQNQYLRLVNGNESLKAEITQKSRLERIEKIAIEQLKMTYPKEQPVWFELDPAKMKSSRIE